MTATAKMVLFMVCATVAQLIVIGLIIILFSLLGVLLLGERWAIFLLIGLVAALPISFILYGWVMKKISPWLEKNVPQLFRRKR